MNGVCVAVLLALAATRQPVPPPIVVDWKPALTIRVDSRTGDVWLSVVSPRPWRLEWSGDMVHWVELRRGTPEPDSVDIFQGVDRGWAKIAARGFYRLLVEETGGTDVVQWPMARTLPLLRVSSLRRTAQWGVLLMGKTPHCDGQWPIAEAGGVESR